MEKSSPKTISHYSSEKMYKMLGNCCESSVMMSNLVVCLRCVVLQSVDRLLHLVGLQHLVAIVSWPPASSLVHSLPVAIRHCFRVVAPLFLSHLFCRCRLASLHCVPRPPFVQLLGVIIVVLLFAF